MTPLCEEDVWKLGKQEKPLQTWGFPRIYATYRRMVSTGGVQMRKQQHGKYRHTVHKCIQKSWNYMCELKTKRHQILWVTWADQLPGQGWVKGACLLYLFLYAHHKSPRQAGVAGGETGKCTFHDGTCFVKRIEPSDRDLALPSKQMVLGPTTATVGCREPEGTLLIGYIETLYYCSY